MNQANKIARRFVATLLLSTIALSAIADSIGTWQAGTNYLLLEKPQAPALARGKVEVNEVFWYGCGHCYALDPTLETWKAGKPAFIEFVRTPVIWGPVHRQHARLFYTLQALGRGELHPVVFEAIHRKGNLLAAQSDPDARALHLAFLKEHGVTEKAFAEAYDSAAVTDHLSRAEQLTNDFAVGSVPIIFVNGKYSTSVSQAGSESQLLSVINDLAASERRR